MASKELYQELYAKCFNAITDMIKAKEDEINDLKKLHQELEEIYCTTPNTIDLCGSVPADGTP